MVLFFWSAPYTALHYTMPHIHTHTHTYTQQRIHLNSNGLVVFQVQREFINNSLEVKGERKKSCILLTVDFFKNLSQAFSSPDIWLWFFSSFLPVVSSASDTQYGTWWCCLLTSGSPSKHIIGLPFLTPVAGCHQGTSPHWRVVSSGGTCFFWARAFNYLPTIQVLQSPILRRWRAVFKMVPAPSCRLSLSREDKEQSLRLTYEQHVGEQESHLLT